MIGLSSVMAPAGVLLAYAAAAAKSLQSCWTLCDPIDGYQGLDMGHELTKYGLTKKIKRQNYNYFSLSHFPFFIGSQCS